MTHRIRIGLWSVSTRTLDSRRQTTLRSSKTVRLQPKLLSPKYRPSRNGHLNLIQKKHTKLRPRRLLPSTRYKTPRPRQSRISFISNMHLPACHQSPFTMNHRPRSFRLDLRMIKSTITKNLPRPVCRVDLHRNSWRIGSLHRCKPIRLNHRHRLVPGQLLPLTVIEHMSKNHLPTTGQGN